MDIIAMKDIPVEMENVIRTKGAVKLTSNIEAEKEQLASVKKSNSFTRHGWFITSFSVTNLSSRKYINTPYIFL